MPRAACDAWSVDRTHTGRLSRVDGSAPVCAPPVAPAGAAGVCSNPRHHRHVQPLEPATRTTRELALAGALRAGSGECDGGVGLGPRSDARRWGLGARSWREERCVACAVGTARRVPWKRRRRGRGAVGTLPRARPARAGCASRAHPTGRHGDRRGLAAPGRTADPLTCSGSRAKREGMGPALRAFALFRSPSQRGGRRETARPQASTEARRRSCRRSSSFMWILHTRDSLRPSSSPISRSDRSSQYFR